MHFYRPVGFLVNDLVAACEHLRSAGTPFYMEPNEGMSGIAFALECVQRLPFLPSCSAPLPFVMHLPQRALSHFHSVLFRLFCLSIGSPDGYWIEIIQRGVDI